MGKIRYTIRLSDDERKKLNAIVKNEIITDKEKMRAKILLLSDLNVKSEKVISK